MSRLLSVGICLLPQIQFQVILEESIIFMQTDILVPNYSQGSDSKTRNNFSLNLFYKTP